jgi:hypothetical protein
MFYKILKYRLILSKYLSQIVVSQKVVKFLIFNRLQHFKVSII